jgi:hypothetical protein
LSVTNATEFPTFSTLSVEKTPMPPSTYKCRAGAGTLLLAAHEEHDGDKEAWQPRRVERRSVDSV